MDTRIFVFSNLYLHTLSVLQATLTFVLEFLVLSSPRQTSPKAPCPIDLPNWRFDLLISVACLLATIYEEEKGCIEQTRRRSIEGPANSKVYLKSRRRQTYLSLLRRGRHAGGSWAAYWREDKGGLGGTMNVK